MLVTKTLRNSMKHLLHTCHLGIVKTINRVKEIIYQPGINNDITNIEICLEHRNKQKQESIIPHDMPNTPWTRVAIDIFHIERKLYLALVSYTTIFFDISQLPDKLSSMVVIHVKHFFSKYGIPKQSSQTMVQNSQQIHSQHSRNNEMLKIPPQVYAIPRVMDKSKGQFK